MNIPVNCTSELDFCRLFLSDLLLKRIFNDSQEKYKKRRGEGSIKEFAFSIEDMERKFLADLSMSLNTRPSIKLHFAEDSELYGNPFLRRIGMSAAQYWNLNVIQSCNLDLLEAYLNQRFSHYYSPGVFISIDEGLIRFTGRYFYKQFIPNKPAGEGIKTFAAACAQTGYCLRFFFYRKRFMEDIDKEDPGETCTTANCEGDNLYQCEICCKSFCENHVLPDTNGTLECHECMDNIYLETSSRLLPVH